MRSLTLRLCLLTLAVSACAHVHARDAAVVPGLNLRLGRTHSADTIVFQRSMNRAGRDSSAGTRAVVLRVIEASTGTQLLEVEQRFPGGGREIVDTALAELRTLRAVAHQSHQPARTMRFTFSGTDAVGTVASVGTARDSVIEVRQVLGGPIFDSNVIDLVVAALPLHQGFTADLPFFIYERGGRVSIPVAVRERASVPFSRLGPRDVWIVSVGVPGAPATVWVDTKDHAALRVRYDITARALSFTDERVTPLHG
ncbi:MAG TPA: hypothetical protein VKC15_08855 [Gemmatimonadales bacterium]|nr:hypothetical protein [Gemmatimonadales bacterium]